MQTKTMFVVGLCLSIAANALIADEVTIDTYQGSATVATNPETIAVYDVSVLDVLHTLDIIPAATVSNLYVDYLAEVSESADVVGSLFEPDFEAVNALSPDLVIVGGRSSTQLEAMSKIAPTIDMTVWGDNLFDQVLARLDAFGAIFEKEDRATEVANAFLAQQTATKEATADGGNALIVMTNGPTISAYGVGSRFGWIHTELGIEEAVQNVEDATHGEAISFEFIHDVNPDWLIVIDRVAAIGADGESAAQTLDNELIADTDAWKNGQVIYLNSANIYIAVGGIQALTDAMVTIANAFDGNS